LSDDTGTAPKRTFTYEEAAALLPEVQRLTEEAHRATDALRQWGGSPAEAQSRIDDVLTRWARAMLAHGLEVKGLWLVDFDNGSGYYCWKHPESSLQFYHSYEEGFTGRMRIQ
jgi:hypothetical protein